MIRIFLFFTFVSTLTALYEDQIGKFDWRKQYIGRVSNLYWEQITGSSGGKKAFVSTDKNVIASVNTGNGNIVWRKVFEEGRRGEVDHMIYTGNALISILAGTRVQAWTPGTGILVWEAYIGGQECHIGKVGYIEDGSKGIAVGLSSEKLVGMKMRDGEKLWEVELPNPMTA